MSDDHNPANKEEDPGRPLDESFGGLIKQMRDMEASIVRAFQGHERLINALPFLTPSQYSMESRLLDLEVRVRILELETERTRRRN